VGPRSNPNRRSEFAHPIEAEFARLLDFYRIPWEYEPTTFPLAEDEAGKLLEAFTPDFFLPLQELYVELTTRRQDLITNKHRKIRALRAHYPEVSIKLLNRRDMTSLLLKYGMAAETPNLIGDPNNAHGTG
jgi:hypothetical protein